MHIQVKYWLAFLILVMVATSCGSAESGSSSSTATDQASTAEPESSGEETETEETEAAEEETEAAEEAEEAAPADVEAPLLSDTIDDFTGEPVQLLDSAETIEVLLGNIDKVWSTALTSGWPGYDPNDFPLLVLLFDRDRNPEAALALNTPDPGSLGAGLVEIDTAGTAINHAVLINEPSDETFALKPDGIPFAFAPLGETFGIAFGANRGDAVSGDPAGFGDSFFNPTQQAWVEVATHELFHLYQIFNWGQQPEQIMAGDYVFTPEGLEMAALEDRALLAALHAEDDDARDTALRHFVGIRLTRIAAEPTVERDVWQEMLEGSARFNDRLLSNGESGWQFTQEDWGLVDLINDPKADATATKAAHDRFYESGAIQIRMIDEMGIDVAAEMALPTPPSVILQNALGVTDADAGQLLADARSAYDPDGDLLAKATASAAAANAG